MANVQSSGDILFSESIWRVRPCNLYKQRSFHTCGSRSHVEVKPTCR